MNLHNKNIAKYARYLENWLLSVVSAANAKGVVFGLSGGIDSAVVAAMAKQIFKHNYLAVVMHINNSSLDKKCTDKIIEQLKLNSKVVNLLPATNNFIKNLNLDKKQDNVIIGNFKARLRMATLYALAQKNNYLVCGTSNYDEWLTGYFTKYGDSACDVAVLRNTLKTDVYALGKHYCVPEIILNRPPTAGLIINQTDENDLGFTYSQLDNHLLKIKKLEKNVLKRFNELKNNSNHKRKLPLAPSPLLK